MNREIKFRAFDGVDYVTKPFTLLDIQNGKIQFASSDTKIMQFTGLKSKNGIEIYEGDVVKAEWHWQDGKIVDLSYESEFFYSVQEYAIEDVLEIIGNIYQNPDILETVKK